MTKFIAFGDLLHLRAGISDGNKAAANVFFANDFFDALVKILIENIGFKCAAGFAGDDEQCNRQINFIFESFDLRGVSGIQT